MGKRYTQEILLLIVTLIILILFNYSFLDESLENFLIDYEEGVVDRVIDGDTIVINDTTIRMLGINTPERGERYYEEATEFLENLILNQSVQIIHGKEPIDRYGRTLAYISKDNENINLELVEQGYANFYFPSGKDIYYEEFKSAWEICINNNIYLCEKSVDVCASCIELKEFGDSDKEVVLYNKCGFECDLTAWTIKDEGRKKFEIPNFQLEPYKKIKIKVGQGIDNENVLLWNRTSYVWTSSGDTLFLRDNYEGLVLWESY